MATPLDKESRSVTRETIGGLEAHHGPDRGRRIKATLAYGDILVLRLKGTRRTPKVIRIHDVYDYVVRCEALKVQLEKARLVKAKKDERARERRLAADIRRLLKSGF